jgi:hypothetical protein
VQEPPAQCCRDSFDSEDQLEGRDKIVYSNALSAHSRGTPAATNADTPDAAVQVVLADLLEEPGREVISWIQTRYPGRDGSFYAPIISGVRSTIDEVIGGLQKQPKGDPSPTLLDRLCFSWRLLKRADTLVRKTKKSDIPAISRLEHAASTFRTILPAPLQQPLLAALLKQLRVGANAEYLYHYFAFRWAKQPSKLPNPFGNLETNKNPDLLRILIWWCVRARREEYIEIRPGEPVRVEFGYVIEQIIQDLKRWCGPRIEEIPDLNEQVESELNAWLAYSRLDFGADETAPDSVDPELAKAFIKHNELTTKLRVHRPVGQSENDERVRQLEAQVRQYAEENRQLEENVRTFETTPRPAVSVPADSDTTSSYVELREVLKTLDTKYAFDTLNSVQLGDETHLTLRSFVAHLFYALRKRGFSEYPKEDEFVLTYEMSGLFDCDGFEVPPSGSIKVRVTRKGWAFNVRNRWLPVRRARLVASPEHSSEGSE